MICYKSSSYLKGDKDLRMFEARIWYQKWWIIWVVISISKEAQLLPSRALQSLLFTVDFAWLLVLLLFPLSLVSQLFQNIKDHTYKGFYIYEIHLLLFILFGVCNVSKKKKISLCLYILMCLFPCVCFWTHQKKISNGWKRQRERCLGIWP